jgi:trans-aconitate 2-methyltransferase
MWSTGQYEKFKSERQQPFFDLLALVEKRPRMRVADLGCGTGELTRELHTALGVSETVGIDDSDAMLAKARTFAGDGVTFEKKRIQSFEPGVPFDLLFSNAVFHWVPDHIELFARLTAYLSADGQLAVQMPANDSHASHQVAAEVGHEFGVEPRPDFVLPIERYAALLHRLGYRQQQVRMQVYGHVLPSTGDVVEWVRVALLTHYQSLLSPERFEQYLAAYREQLRAVLGDQQPYFYTYKRVLIWAAR